MWRDKKAMTIIEVMIVCAIIGILASIVIVTYANTRKKAVLTEAVTAMGSIRVVMRHHYAEYGRYQELGGFLNPDNQATYPEGIRPGYLDGAYFRDKCYSLDSTTGNTYSIRCYPGYSDNQAAKKLADGTPDNSYIKMYPDGTFRQRNVSASCYPPE